MLRASEWIYYYNYDRSHDGLGGKSPAEALQEVNPKLSSLQDPEGKDILFLPPTVLDDRITLLGGGTEVYRYYTERNLQLGTTTPLLAEGAILRYGCRTPFIAGCGITLLDENDGPPSIGSIRLPWCSGSTLTLCILLQDLKAVPPVASRCPKGGKLSPLLHLPQGHQAHSQVLCSLPRRHPKLPSIPRVFHRLPFKSTPQRCIDPYRG